MWPTDKQNFIVSKLKNYEMDGTEVIIDTQLKLHSVDAVNA